MKALKSILPMLIIVSLLAIPQVTAAHVLAPGNSIHILEHTASIPINTTSGEQLEEENPVVNNALTLFPALASPFLVEDYQVVEEQKTDLSTYSAEVSRLNSELNQRDIEVKQLATELTTAQEEAAYWEGKAHPRQFTSVEELKAWLASNDINAREYIPDTYDCDDFARDLMIAALEDGYLVSTELWSCHMLNSTIIGNDIYTIEPMTDGVQFVGELDPTPAGDNHK
jgi:outer membrane murein-binding lipoprotein Lpp